MTAGSAPARRRPRPQPRRSPYTRYRVATLVAVHVLIGLHIAHWLVARRTLAPLEFNEVLYTIHLGIVTAGFLFMATAVLTAVVAGRFVCGWGCHLLALQDLCAWLLERARIRPRPVRSRALLLVPPGAMLYLFVWPQVERVIAGRPLPSLHVVRDGQGWASFVTSDFWRNLPGPGIAAATFLVCAGALVYLLGSRAFCLYACPYAALFAAADRVAPGRIVLRGDCTRCGLCTAVCRSHVRVHEEVTRHGMVVSSACLKDLDCVGVCPERALAVGFARPPVVARARAVRWRPDLTVGEEVLAAAAFIATVLVSRGLHGAVPFLMALGLGGVSALTAVAALRTARGRRMRIGRHQLVRGARPTRAGAVLLAVALALGGLAAHSALVRAYEVLGERALHRLVARPRPPEAALTRAAARTAATEALDHLRWCERWGLVRPPSLLRRLASLEMILGFEQDAERHLRAVLAAVPDDGEARRRLAQLHARAGAAPPGR